MNKLKHHFLGGLVFLGTISFGYIGYTYVNTYTNLSTQTDGAVITKDIWNNVITTINGIGNRTDGIYSNGGNIGIGTNNTTSKLTIRGRTEFFSNGVNDRDSDAYYLEKIQTSPNNNSLRLSINDDGGSNESFQIWGNACRTTGCPGEGTGLLVVQGGGNVGIGTASPSAKLEVNGDIVSKALVFKAYMSAAFAHPGGVWTKLPFNTIRFNTLPGTFDSRNKRFTPSRAGYYQISITGYSTTSSARNDRYAIGVLKNGGLEGFRGSSYSLVDTPLSGPTMIVYCNGTSDYIEISMFSAIAANLSGGNSGGHVMYWYMDYLGN